MIGLNASSILLYDLVKDPLETRNLAAELPEVVKRLSALLEQYNRTAVSSAQQGLPNDPNASPSRFNGTVTPWE